jgi:hypothetical protein
LLPFTTNLLGIMVGAMASLAALEKACRRRLFNSRLGLTSAALTALLVIPLGSSFLRLAQQARRQQRAQQLEAAIEQRLRSGTITLGGDPAINLVGLNVDWQQNPPLIRARVRVSDPQLPTPTPVAAVQGVHQPQPGSKALPAGAGTQCRRSDRPGDGSQSGDVGAAAHPGACAGAAERSAAAVIDPATACLEGRSMEVAESLRSLGSCECDCRV